MPKAFTLVELIIVIGIMGLLISLGPGGITAYQQTLTLGLATEKLAAELRLAQNLAIASGDPHGLVFLNTQDYILERSSFLKNTIISKKSLPSGLQFVQTGKTVFAHSGFPYVNCQKSIAIKGRKNKTQKIIISNVGRIRIE